MRVAERRLTHQYLVVASVQCLMRTLDVRERRKSREQGCPGEQY